MSERAQRTPGRLAADTVFGGHDAHPVAYPSLAEERAAPDARTQGNGHSAHGRGIDSEPLSPHHLRLLREHDAAFGTRYAADEAREESARALRAQVAAERRRADDLMARCVELEATLARAQAERMPMTAADLAVAWGLSLPGARRVWRVLKKEAR